MLLFGWLFHAFCSLRVTIFPLIQPNFELRKTFFIQRSTSIGKFSVRFVYIVRLFYFIPVYLSQFLLKSFYWITWVISFVYNSSLASIVSTRHLNMKNMEKWSDMSVSTPVLNSAFITEFVMIWSIAVAAFLVTRVGLFTVGVRPLRNIKLTKLLLWLKSRTLTLKSPSKTR